jgi:predicted nuclease with TOPRIM domain|tara:strand:- start:10743 stop:10919 length:177 start_codon:yes stop_codon:yes gene_type:complete
MDYNTAAIEALRKKLTELQTENKQIETENALLLKSINRLKDKIEHLKPTVISSSNLNI